MSIEAWKRIAVIGGGAWGTALAIHAAENGSEVRLWVREPEVAEAIRLQRENTLFLPGVRVPDDLLSTSDLDQAIDGAELIVGVVPSRFAGEIYRQMLPQLSADAPLVIATKGIEQETLALPTQVAEVALGPDHPIAVLSGPSFAAELVAGQPTAVVAASTDAGLARRVQRSMASGTLRIYSDDDPVGVQLAGALKNVIAIAAGVADGLGMGHNTQAALITRGLAEMTRLGLAMGAHASTFSGLAGMGDLVLTCTGSLSRNRTTGRRLGRGESLNQIREGAVTVAEGVTTTRSAKGLAARYDVDMPIVHEVHRILYEGGSAGDAIRRLMSRPLRSEKPAE